MSIVTKTGDQGMTSLMYGRRVSKSDPRIEACGTVDELNAALGLARASAAGTRICPKLEVIQKHLVPLMGELATTCEDVDRYGKEGYVCFAEQYTTEIEEMIREIEAAGLSFRGWAMPGDTISGATLDVARTVCRRAERTVCAVVETGNQRFCKVLVYLNRVSDLLWLLARQADIQHQKAP